MKKVFLSIVLAGIVLMPLGAYALGEKEAIQKTLALLPKNLTESQREKLDAEVKEAFQGLEARDKLFKHFQGILTKKKRVGPKREKLGIKQFMFVMHSMEGLWPVLRSEEARIEAFNEAVTKHTIERRIQ